MLSANDKAIPILYRAVLVICVFLIFGMILNGVLLRKDRLIEERNHDTAIRISLIREEYARKMSDLRQKYKYTCEQTVQEVALNLKRIAKQTTETKRVELEKFYEKALKNQSDEIELMKEELKRISDKNPGYNREEKRLSVIEDIEKRLSALKSTILDGTKAKDDNLSSATKQHDKFSAEEQKVLSKVTERLEELEKDLDRS